VATTQSLPAQPAQPAQPAEPALPALSDIPDDADLSGVIRIETSDKDVAKEIIFDRTRAVYPHEQMFGEFCPINAYIAAPPREV
jgi:hypothetical protein